MCGRVEKWTEYCWQTLTPRAHVVKWLNPKFMELSMCSNWVHRIFVTYKDKGLNMKWLLCYDGISCTNQNWWYSHVILWQIVELWCACALYQESDQSNPNACRLEEYNYCFSFKQSGWSNYVYTTMIQQLCSCRFKLVLSASNYF